MGTTGTREGRDLRPWQGAIRPPMPAPLSRRRTVQAAWPRCCTSCSCSAKQSPSGHHLLSSKPLKRPVDRLPLHQGLARRRIDQYSKQWPLQTWSTGHRDGPADQADGSPAYCQPWCAGGSGGSRIRTLRSLVHGVRRLSLVCWRMPGSRQPREPIQPRAAPAAVSRSDFKSHTGPFTPSPPESHLMPASAQKLRALGSAARGATSGQIWERSRRLVMR